MNSKSLHSALLVFFISMLAIISCKKDIENQDQTPTPGNPFSIPAANPVTGSVSGIVIDEHNTPVDGAEVKLGALITTSDAKGIFSFKNAALDKYITTVTINKSGYFKAYRSFSGNATRNYLNIKLVPKILSGTVSSGSAGVVTLGNGTVLSFQPNSMVVKSTGAAYSGTVNVYAAYIDPTASDISAVVPGSFMGKDGNNLFSLQSTGMIAVELESGSGQPLQLASALPANIKLPIPASLLSKAPASINTWSLNEQGVWVKEGTANRSGNFYEMEVSHFSFWNCDVPANAIYLTLHVQDQAGNALVNTLVQLTIPNNNTWWATTYGYTDSLGNVSGLVPAAQSLEMNVFSNPYSCSNPVFTQTIGPFSANTTLTVTATLTAAEVLTVSGTATNCGGQPLQNGTAVIYAGQYNYQYVTIVNGAYTATITHCTPLTEVTVIVIDNSNGNQNTSGAITVSGNSVTIPSVSACGTSQPAIFTFGNIQGSCQTSQFIGTYTAGVPVSNNLISMTVNVLAIGSYTITTPTVNGISFSGSGVFTSTGTQDVILTATGTPLNAGTYTFVAESGGMTGCAFVIPVSGVQAPQAVIDLGSPGSCSNIFVNGSYIAGVPLNTTNTATITVNVTTPGTYYIFTNNTNGMLFSDSGTVTASGQVTLVLQGSGTPLSAGFNTYQLQSSNGTAGCSFGITTQASSNAANFTFNGAPGNCTSAIVSGTYAAGLQLNSSDSVTITINVVTPGTYSINTNNTNGMSFAAQGIFTATGPQAVTLTATGTPTMSGVYTFIPQAGNITGCVFIVPVN